MIPILCFHHAGGSGASFLSWRKVDAPDIEIIPISLPTTRPITGRRSYTSATALVEHVLTKHATTLRKSHVLYGHSMGGLLAYLLARRLNATSEYANPAALIVAASWCPRLRPSVDIDHMDDAELIALLEQIGGIPAALTDRPEWLYPMLPIVRDDLRMCHQYRHDHTDDSLNIPIYVIGARDDRLVSGEQIEGWSDMGTRVSIEYQSGGHFFDADPQQLCERTFALARAAVDEAQLGLT
ncbi:thioesterase II family protein [Mycobacterium montefiorense]|uniref:Thioesterase TesA n=1 Tax=Mycobacterium montefiorense TaxID=154654 RepID=A0AA37UTC4_9MYCO|nr:alpha/beta fold hydrolase [Mycobacterium montefiorense]GBG35994.1 putative thioesterase [Mycobacterium montefiorense]GKU33994.1 putative thioesterase [Mycobacterium montefiorense]GKU41392.1 putative thioesterase [Mycobacterium montefiorense]GKU47490.1 putative thioesterase [Mycobacterium montefiorense]GKU52288.1 putative thioesterase [Mycobacterium montefiorense]